MRFTLNDLTAFIKHELLSRGADLVGFGSLSELHADVRENVPVGICVALN
jgi:hypothetical protein